MSANEDWRAVITQLYRASRGDSSALFAAVVALGHQHGLEPVLAHLERCVIEKRLAWLAANLPCLPRTGNPLLDGYTAFYECYLGLSIARDGDVVSITARRLVTRWRNPCPTLAACVKLGLDTRLICRRVYQEPVTAFLRAIDSRLSFSRNYETLRPYGPCCEEIIELTGAE